MNRRCLVGLSAVGFIVAFGAFGVYWTFRRTEQESPSTSPDRLEPIEVAIGETLARAEVLIDRFDAMRNAGPSGVWTT